MARIRTIKPSFFTSLTIADLTLSQRLTFIGLWTHVDDDGRCIYDPRLIKAALWPLDDRTADDIADDVRALTEASLITQYTAGDRSYLHVRTWDEHQRINRKTPSTLPAPEEGQIVGLTSTNEDSVSAHGVLTEGVHREGNKEGKGREGKKRVASGSDAAPSEPLEQRVTTDAYERVGKAFNFIATRQIVKWALNDRGATPTAVRDAVVAIYEMGKPITKQTIGQYLDGHIKRGGATDRPLDRQAEILRREMQLAQDADTQLLEIEP